MNIFDDLGDPLGPPAGDALGAVLARARRRRRARRSTAAAVAVVAVVAIAVSANAMAGDSGKVRVEGPTPTSTSTSTTSTTSLSTTTTTSPAARHELWSGRQLTIAPGSLGLVAVGQTLDAAQIAAGLKFEGAADGAYYPTSLPTAFPHLFVHLDPGSTVVCVGAEIGSQAADGEVVTTPEGFRLGDTVKQLKAIYGTSARYVPAPSGGISPRAGYVVEQKRGNLAFYLDSTQTRIFGIKAGGRDLTPSSCNG